MHKEQLLINSVNIRCLVDLIAMIVDLPSYVPTEASSILLILYNCPES